MKSRMHLIDQEMAALQGRIDRLKLEDDYFEGLKNTGKKNRPVAINEKGSNIYE